MPLPRNQLLRERIQKLGLALRDFEETFTRSSGPGGQHVNKVSTSATVRHIPTGQSVTAADTRSQSANRQLAWMRLVEEFEQQKLRQEQRKKADAAKARRQRAKRSRATKTAMVESKRRRGETKKLRRKIED